MHEEIEFALEEAKEGMHNAILHLEKELQKVRAGKASPQMLDGVRIDYYGVMTPIDQTANISTPDARQIIVQPWDKSVLGLIEKAILAANLGFNPKHEGDILRIVVPALTEERRRDLVRKAKLKRKMQRSVSGTSVGLLMKLPKNLRKMEFLKMKWINWKKIFRN